MMSMLSGTLDARGDAEMDVTVKRQERLVRLEQRRRIRVYRRRKKARERSRLQQLCRERLSTIAPYVQHPTRRNTRARCIRAPESINLSENFEETIDFLNRVRECASASMGRFFVDFTTIRDLTPAGALLLVAEFDRWRELIKKQRLEPIELEKWNPVVTNRLIEMGFFDLLGSSKRIDRVADVNFGDGERYLPFISGHRAEGEKAKQLRVEIERLGPKLRDRQSLFEGLTEAMTNVEHHAYPADAQMKRWWMSASVDATGQRLRVMFLDHGLGIPQTLPPDIVEAAMAAMAIGPLEELIKSDAKLIRAAISLQRSQTGKPNRGWGLKRDVQGYIERHDAVGSLRIVSRKGQYRYRKQTGQRGRISTKALPVPFKGTFIEWIIEEYAASESHD